MREPIAIHEDTNARRSSILFFALPHAVPVSRGNGDVVDVDVLAVAGLVVADEEGDVLCSKLGLFEGKSWRREDAV